MTYIAFLRGINVGGKNPIRMDVLCALFEKLKLRNVRTYIQCGNVLFDSASTDSRELAKLIERQINQTTGHEVTVILRTLTELDRLLKLNPFKAIGADQDVMLCVAFLSTGSKTKPSLPCVFAKERLELIAIRDRAAFVVARRRANGWFGFPNNFVEKELQVSATTRQWSTLRKLAAFARRPRS